MALPELFANSPTPGAKVPIGLLAADVNTTPAANTIEVWNLNSVASVPAALLNPGQFRMQVGNEIVLDITGGGGTARTVMRGVEGSPISVHKTGDQVFHYLTAGALQNLVSQAQPPQGAFNIYGPAAAMTVAAAKLAMPTKLIDVSGWVTNSRFQPQVAGYYQISGGVESGTATQAGDWLAVGIYKNGAQLPGLTGYAQGSPATLWSFSKEVSALVYLNGTTDYVELWGQFSNAGAARGLTFTPWMTGTMVTSPGTGTQEPATVTNLPSTPYDGQEVYYVADAANGVNWHLRYNAGSASAHKWEYIGGPAIVATVVTAEPCTADSTWRDLATVGPSFVLALPGDYDVDFEVNPDSAAPGAAYQWYCGVRVNNAIDSRYVQWFGPAQAAEVSIQLRGMLRSLDVPAGATVKLVYQARGAAPTFGRREIHVTPVRVG